MINSENESGSVNKRCDKFPSASRPVNEPLCSSGLYTEQLCLWVGVSPMSSTICCTCKAKVAFSKKEKK